VSAAAPPATLAARLADLRTERWITYARAAAVLRELAFIYTQPPTHRMPCLLLTGISNNGKTKLLHRFCRDHPAVEHPSGERRVHPVVYALCPAVPDERRLYAAILDAVDAPHHLGESAPALYRRVLLVLRLTETRVVILDEAQHLLAGPQLRHRQMLNTLKLISNELQLSIVAAGTPEAHNAIRADEQMASRFQPVDLPRWSADGAAGLETRRLLVSLEQSLPLGERSHLDAPALVAKLVARGNGTIGGMVRLVTRAAVLALETGRERIDGTLIERAAAPGVGVEVVPTGA
jgi:hypothetical protein